MLHKTSLDMLGVWVFFPLILVFCPKRLIYLDFGAWEVLISPVLRPVCLIMWPSHGTFFAPSMIQQCFWSFLLPVLIKISSLFYQLCPQIKPAWEKKKKTTDCSGAFFTLYKLEEAWKLWSFSRKLQNSCNHIITTVNEMETTKYSNWFEMQNKCFLPFSKT